MTFAHHDGAEVFPIRLAEAGIVITRVTETDVKELAVLREQEGFARASGLAYKPHHLAADLVAGDLVAVTTFGDVHRINPEKLGDAKQYLAVDLPGVIETRARFELEREQTSALWDRRRTDAAAARQDFAAEREGRHQAAETARDVRRFNQEIGEAVDTGFKVSGGFLRGLTRAVEKFFDFLGDMIAPAPPPTKDQAERMVRVADENQQVHEQTAQANERTEAQHWLVEEARRRAAEREAGLSPESERPREPDRGGYERERGYER